MSENKPFEEAKSDKEIEKRLEEEPELDIKEKRIRKIALTYYSRKDILESIYNFSKDREISPRYFEGFGKRPDSFQYPNDILALVKKGATSFHCSEELWQEPLQLSTEMTEEQLNNLRTGWDVVFDIDCKWIDYSKKAAQAIIKVLEKYGVKNIGVKFSGSKGFHIIIPWQAFPEEINEIKTKDKFPEWARAIAGFVTEKARPILEESIKDTTADFKDIKGFTGIKCETCHNLANENFQIILRCSDCHPPHIEMFNTSDLNYKKKKCPMCRKELVEVEKRKFFTCTKCNINSLTTPRNFNEGVVSTDIFKILGMDIQLVSSRHLFRMPYSLHEKTSLSSIVIPKEKLSEFNLKDADPMNVKPINFLPTTEPDEAKNLLFQAIDWQKDQEREAENQRTQYNETALKTKRDFKPVDIENLKEDDFPPTIIQILKGMADGRKRALFILINFYRCLGKTIEETEELVNEWNKKNKPPLKQGYINSQLIWASKKKIIMPPNFTNNIYKEIGVLKMDSMSEKAKNPVNYVVRKSGVWKKKKR